MSFGLLCGRCTRLLANQTCVVTPLSNKGSINLELSSRHFSSTPGVLASRVATKKPKLTKKQLALIAKKRAEKREKNAYAQEKMTLPDAIAVLRAVEVARPHSTYEITIRTAMSRGAPVPTGRINLPREAKPKKEARILVFAEGRQAEEARRAGAHTVGGLELVESVAAGKHNNCTTVLCTTSLIRGITSKLGRVLGPRGLMPSERRGTVTDDIEGYISRLSSTTEWRGDKSGTIRMPIAKVC
ncbi:ribosomal protein L1 [Pisolithus orientalis]|uniref:ribosomal protein L1 n=1 Tax=Pisolithus orientalis TaxID=936130 RepID=UPI00222588F7|nr:ribosomal protein L1 [Pisolithus orientalis]KAI6012539.1 ribosomal protein L1 [Pisolithus orientalis]